MPANLCASLSKLTQNPATFHQPLCCSPGSCYCSCFCSSFLTGFLDSTLTPPCMVYLQYIKQRDCIKIQVDHVTPLIQPSLSFLRIKAEVLTSVFYKVLCDQTSCYLSDLISDYSVSSALYSSHRSPLKF